MEKTVLQNLIDRRSDMCKGKSVVWNNLVKVKVDSEFVDYVKCVRYDTALEWKSRDGTSGLRAHITSCSPLSSSGIRHITVFTDVPGFVTKTPSVPT